MDHTYIHGGKNVSGQQQQSTPYHGGWQYPQWTAQTQQWQEQNNQNQTPKKSPRRSRAKSAKGSRGGDTPRGKGPMPVAGKGQPPMMQPPMIPMMSPMTPFPQYAPPLPPPETPWTPAAAMGQPSNLMPAPVMMPHPVMMPTLPPGMTMTPPTIHQPPPKSSEPDYKGFYMKAKQRQSELPSDMQQDVQRISVKEGAKSTKDLYAAVKALDNARKEFDEAVHARTQSHNNWKQFLGDAVQLWKSYAEQFAAQEKTFQDQVNATREVWRIAKEELDSAKCEAGEIQEIKSDEEQENAPNDSNTSSTSASKISESMQGLATSLATLHQEAEEWVEQDRQAAKRPRREKPPEPGDTTMEPGEHFGAAG
eukprot:s1574_g15.t1